MLQRLRTVKIKHTGMTRYSQNNEQDIILHYFSNQSGVFLDIGANDGVTLSNTYALQQLNWAGVLVEPSEKAFNRIYRNERVCTFNVAIGQHDGTCSFYEMGNHLNRGDVSLLSTIKKSETNRWKRHRVQFKERITEVWTIATLLQASKYKVFDFISIDAEGMDFEILEQINLQGTAMVCIEHNGNKDLFRMIKDYCNAAGLTKCLLTNSENVIWAR
jgi:FkbM family methyltransferase